MDIPVSGMAEDHNRQSILLADQLEKLSTREDGTKLIAEAYEAGRAEIARRLAAEPEVV